MQERLKSLRSLLPGIVAFVVITAALIIGINSIGLARHGFSEDQISRVKEAYRILFRSKLPLEDAVERLRTELGDQPEIQALLTFVTTSERGLTR